MKKLFNLPARNPEAKTEAEIFLDAAKVAYKRDRNGVITVTGSLYLNDRQLETLPDLSRVVVEGSFHAGNNLLTTLEQAPRVVKGGYFVQNNRLTTLKGAPEEVGGGFDCRNNLLTSLEHAPRRVSALFWCAGNQLTTLEGGPESVDGTYACEDNPLKSLFGIPAGHGGIISDLGKFDRGARIPVALRATPEQHQKFADETTILQRDLPISRPLAFRSAKQGPRKPAAPRQDFAVKAPKRKPAPKPKKPCDDLLTRLGKKILPVPFYS